MGHELCVATSTSPQRWSNGTTIAQSPASPWPSPRTWFRLKGSVEHDSAFYHCTEFVEGVGTVTTARRTRHSSQRASTAWCKLHVSRTPRLSATTGGRHRGLQTEIGSNPQDSGSVRYDLERNTLWKMSKESSWKAWGPRARNRGLLVSPSPSPVGRRSGNSSNPCITMGTAAVCGCYSPDPLQTAGPGITHSVLLEVGSS